MHLLERFGKTTNKAINTVGNTIKKEIISKTKKTEPIKEEPKTTEVVITPQEEGKIYEQVAKELKENRHEGVWLKAYTENGGDEAKTKIAYTNKRVIDLTEELKLKND